MPFRGKIYIGAFYAVDIIENTVIFVDAVLRKNPAHCA
jgi:hypothetical protein